MRRVGYVYRRAIVEIVPFLVQHTSRCPWKVEWIWGIEHPSKHHGLAGGLACLLSIRTFLSSVVSASQLPRSWREASPPSREPRFFDESS